MLKPFFLFALLIGWGADGCARQAETTDVATTDAVTTDAVTTDAASANSFASIDLPPELDRVLRDYERGWRGREADSLAALFTPDGFILRPGNEPVRGRAAIAEAYRNGGGTLHLRALDYAQADSVAYIIGAYRTAPNSPDAGKFILTLERSPDGRWYITADMDNRTR